MQTVDMQTVKLDYIVGSVPHLQSLIDEAPMKSKGSRKIRKLLLKSAEELKHFEEVRMQKAKEYGTLNEEGNQYKFEPDAANKFNEEMVSLLNSEVSLSFEPFSEDELFDGDTILKPAVQKALTALDWAMTEPQHKETENG